MPKLQLQTRDKRTNKLKNSGSIEIKNQTENTADLYFYGDIVSESWQSEWYEDDMCPKDVVKFLEQLDNVSTINVHFNSGGGAVFAGIAIGRILKNHSAEVIGYDDGIAASIAGVMLMYCDKVIVPRDAMFMMHKPLTICIGNADDMRKEADILDQCQKIILNVFMDKVKEGVTEDQIDELINKETWLNGEELQKYFNIELSSEMRVAASCESEYFDKYSHVPDVLKREPQNQGIDVNNLAEKIAEILDKKLKSNIDNKITPSELENVIDLEKEKAEILEDLDLI